MVIFHSYVSLPEGNMFSDKHHNPIFIHGRINEVKHKSAGEIPQKGWSSIYWQLYIYVSNWICLFHDGWHNSGYPWFFYQQSATTKNNKYIQIQQTYIPSDQWPFQDPKLEVPTIYKPIWVCLKMLCTPKPSGFADHYPYEKWLAIIGNINPTFSDKPI